MNLNFMQETKSTIHWLMIKLFYFKIIVLKNKLYSESKGLLLQGSIEHSVMVIGILLLFSVSCHENIGSDHQLKKFLIVKKILLVSTTVNVERTVWEIFTLMLGCEGLKP